MWQPIAAREKRRAGLPVKFLAGLGALDALKSSSRGLKAFSRSIEPKIYGRVGNLEVRLARTWSEIKLAQRLRYQVFYEEMSATPSRLAQFRRRDEDAYDAICDHLLVVDLDQTKPARSGRKSQPSARAASVGGSAIAPISAPRASLAVCRSTVPKRVAERSPRARIICFASRCRAAMPRSTACIADRAPPQRSWTICTPCRQTSRLPRAAPRMSSSSSLVRQWPRTP